MAGTADIAVIIPTIGRPELARALDSIRRQDPQPAEVIVAHNGDGPPPDIDGVTVLTLKPMAGPAAARNAGASQATATYLAFLDDDDELGDGYLAAMWKARDPSAVLYPTQVHWAPDGAVTHRLSVPDGDTRQNVLRHGVHPYGGNLFTPRDLFLAHGGFPTDLPATEDRAFAIAVAHGNGRLRPAPAEVHCYSPDGERYTAGPSGNLRSWPRLTVRYWRQMTWPTRIQNVVKIGKRAARFLVNLVRR